MMRPTFVALALPLVVAALAPAPSSAQSHRIPVSPHVPGAGQIVQPGGANMWAPGAGHRGRVPWNVRRSYGAVDMSATRNIPGTANMRPAGVPSDAPILKVPVERSAAVPGGVPAFVPGMYGHPGAPPPTGAPQP